MIYILIFALSMAVLVFALLYTLLSRAVRRGSPWDQEEAARLRKENEDLRRDVQRWRLRALRRGWKPGQYGGNR